MEILEFPARELRLPVEALDALGAGGVAAVTRYGRRRWYVLSDDQFALVAPVLELLLEQGELADDREPYASDLDETLSPG